MREFLAAFKEATGGLNACQIFHAVSNLCVQSEICVSYSITEHRSFFAAAYSLPWQVAQQSEQFPAVSGRMLYYDSEHRVDLRRLYESKLDAKLTEWIVERLFVFLNF